MNNAVILTIAGAAIATYFTRFPLMVLAGNRTIPPKLVKFMGYIAPAVLTALIAPAIFIRQGKLDLSLISNKYIIAAAVTALAAYFSKNMLVSVITGICTVGILMYLL